jgi:hypothetical protein
VFVGVTGWLIAMFYAVVSCAEGLQRFFWGIVEVAVTGLWALFWMAGSAAFAADQRCKIDDILDPFTSLCKTFVASEAFGWMSFLVTIPSLALAIVDWRRGEVRRGWGQRVRGPADGSLEWARRLGRQAASRASAGGPRGPRYAGTRSLAPFDTARVPPRRASAATATKVAGALSLPA